MTPTLETALMEAAAALVAAGLPRDEARRDARLLLAEAAQLEPQAVFAYPERPLAESAAERLGAFVARRAAREPVSRILGRRGFWDLELLVTPAVLDPRPESETLVEAVAQAIPEGDGLLRILDLGTGSGCLLLALLSVYPRAEGLGVDASEEALAVASENARRCGFEGRARWRRGNWTQGLKEDNWDVVVCNPPYIGEGERGDLPPEVRDHDPSSALFAGNDGLAAYRAVLPQAARILRPGGLAVFELGRGQDAAVAGIAREAGLSLEDLRADLAGVPRALVARRPGRGA